VISGVIAAAVVVACVVGLGGGLVVVVTCVVGLAVVVVVASAVDVVGAVDADEVREDFVVCLLGLAVVICAAAVACVVLAAVAARVVVVCTVVLSAEAAVVSSATQTQPVSSDPPNTPARASNVAPWPARFCLSKQRLEASSNTQTSQVAGRGKMKTALFACAVHLKEHSSALATPVVFWNVLPK